MSIYRSLLRQLREAKIGIDTLITGKLLPDYNTYAFHVGKSKGIQVAIDILENFLHKDKDNNDAPREDD